MRFKNPNLSSNRAIQPVFERSVTYTTTIRRNSDLVFRACLQVTLPEIKKYDWFKMRLECHSFWFSDKNILSNNNKNKPVIST